jgi:hypothetical protein
MRASGDAAKRNAGQKMGAGRGYGPSAASLRRPIQHTGAQRMSYSLQQAATACGVNKSTILRAIKAGKVSAVRDEHGQWQVEPAELHRTYPPVAATAERSDATQRAELALANQRAALAEGRLSDLKAMLADMQRDRDAWRDQAQRLALPKPEPESEPKPMSLWRWMRTPPGTAA